jgi:hypothetical protein
VVILFNIMHGLRMRRAIPLLPHTPSWLGAGPCGDVRRKGKKGKAIPVTGRGGPQGCETSWLPHFLDNRRTDGGKVVSLTRRPPLTPRKIPGAHFC